MRILLVAYSFPPFHDAQSIRWYYLANALAELNVKIDVITVKHPDAASPSWMFHENVNVFRIFAGPIECLSLTGKALIGVDRQGNEDLRQTTLFRAAKSLYWLLRRLAGGILPGDVRTEWFPFVVAFLTRNIDLHHYSWVVTSHEPWVDSLIGLYLKATKKRIRWMADFGDPYVAQYTPPHKLFLENRLERRIYRSADTLIFTNDNVITHLEQKYPFMKGKRKLVVEQGFSYRWLQRNVSERPRNDVFTLVYTGTLYRDFRDPSELIKALSMLDVKYTFMLAGRNEGFAKDFAVLGDKFRFLGFIDHFASLGLQQHSDVVVHIGNNASIQIPGKVFEYLGALRPILSINSDAGDPTGKLVEKLNRGVSCPNAASAIRDALSVLYRTWERGDCPFARDPEGIYEYSWERRARSVYAILEKD